MNNKIAVVVDQEGRIGVIENKSRVDIYSKTDREWQLTESVEILIKDISNIEEVRSSVRTVALNLEDCRIVIGKNVSGIAYHILDRLGFYIFEVHEYHPDMFDDIVRDVEEMDGSKERGGDIPLEPYSPENDGVYYLDLIKLQDMYPDISSKKAMAEFLNHEVFLRFELICRHMPPWMEQIKDRRKLNYSIEKIGEDSCRVIITRQNCK